MHVISWRTPGRSTARNWVMNGASPCTLRKSGGSKHHAEASSATGGAPAQKGSCSPRGFRPEHKPTASKHCVQNTVSELHRLPEIKGMFA